MSILFSDDFNTGIDPNVTYWTEEIGTIALSGAKVVFTGSGSTFNYMQTKVAAHAALLDCQITVTITVAGYDGGPIARGSGSGASYTCYYIDVVQGSATVNIYRRVTGTDTLVAAVTLSVAAASGDIFKMYVEGSGANVTFRVYKNGVQNDADKIDSNAARLVTAGRTGLISWNATTVMDDFLVEDLSPSYIGSDMPLAVNQMVG